MSSEFKFSFSYKSSEGIDGFSRIKRYALEIAILVIFLVTLGGFVWWKVYGEKQPIPDTSPAAAGSFLSPTPTPALSEARIKKK